jgi:hypothetical protein
MALAIPDKFKLDYASTIYVMDPKLLRTGATCSNTELKIRKIAFKSIMSTYEDLNTNHKERSDAGFTDEFTIPGWYPIPLSPSYFKEDREIVAAAYWYDEILNYVIPQFDKPMSAALASLKEKSGWAMECTSAQKITEYAIINSVFKPFADTILKTDFLDRKIKESKRYNSITGYKGLNKKILIEEYLPKGIITPEIAELTVLDKQKAKRMMLFLDLVAGFYTKYTNEPRELRAGDEQYIWGHPNYYKKYSHGAFGGENTFLVGYNENGLKLFMGFNKRFLSGPKQLKEIQVWLALEYVGLHDFPEGEEGAKYKTELDAFFTVPRPKIENPSEFIKAFAEIRAQPYTEERPFAISILNVPYIESYWRQDPNFKEGGARKTRRHKAKSKRVKGSKRARGASARFRRRI